MKFDMLGLVVEDISRSLAFYRLVGVDVPEPEPGEPYVETTLPSGLRVSWNAVSMIKEITGHWDAPVGHRMGMAFLCDRPEDVDATYETIVAAGHKGAKAPWDAFWGQRYAQVEDPDGNLVDLFAYLPTEGQA